MASEIIQQIRIDDRLDSYQTFFDHPWARQLSALVSGTKLEEPAWSLCVAWKSAANSHALPWMMMQSMKSFADGLLGAYEPFGLKVISALAQRIPAEMGTSLSNMRRKQLVDVIRRIRNDVYSANQANEERFDVEQAWQSFLDPNLIELHLSIWGSQRICYGALFHAYEDYVRHCVSVARSDPNYRTFFKQLIRDAVALVGQTIADYCLNDRPVQIARLVRNALAHNGGKITDELRGLPHGLAVEDDAVQIMAPDTKQLFDQLKVRAYGLAEVAVTLPNMEKE